MTDPQSADPRAIKSREELAAFIQGLAEDLKSNPGAWTNLTVGAYLDALSGWLGDAGGWAKNMTRLRPDLWLDPQAPSWELFALALRTARTYE